MSPRHGRAPGLYGTSSNKRGKTLALPSSRTCKSASLPAWPCTTPARRRAVKLTDAFECQCVLLRLEPGVVSGLRG